MTKQSVDRAQNAMQQRASKHELTRQLVAHALNVSSDHPVHDEDGEFLGHWQCEPWVERLRGLARELADIEKNTWETFPDEQKWEGWVPPRLRKEDQNANSTGKGKE
jgi:hypothetical protein